MVLVSVIIWQMDSFPYTFFRSKIYMTEGPCNNVCDLCSDMKQ